MLSYKTYSQRKNILYKIIEFLKSDLLHNKYTVGFIHITKTGGTDLKDKNINNEIYFGRYHYEDGKFYNNYLPCFAIIREPIDRFKSLFFYNMFGSTKYGNKKFFKKYTDINDFIEDCKNDINLLQKIENGWQFRPQTKWLNGNKNSIFLMKYNNHNNCNNIMYFLKKEFNIDFNYNACYYKINVTYYDYDVNSNINEKNLVFLNNLYKNDFILYDKLSKIYQPYVRLSKIE